MSDNIYLPSLATITEVRVRGLRSAQLSAATERSQASTSTVHAAWMKTVPNTSAMA